MSVWGTSLFLLCGVVGLLSAIATVSARSPIRAAVGLLAHIVSLAGLFLTLYAPTIAVIQLIVYAGAVVVLFIFAIMFIGPIPTLGSPARPSLANIVSIACMTVLAGAFAYLLLSLHPSYPVIDNCSPVSGPPCYLLGSVGAFSQFLFRRAVVPFELVSALLTVAVVGAIMIARGRRDRA
jgi:NADH-quinone oxidoreductase subunit J